MSDDESSLIALGLLLHQEAAGRRDRDLREMFNGLRSIVKTGAR